VSPPLELPETARKAADSQIERLRVIPPESAEHSVVRTYLEWLASLPWATSTEDHLDLLHARSILDEDHYGLDKVKDRILEFLAVRKLKRDPRSPILCFVGPPGVGKTSLGRSIARAMGRRFIRLSLGGVRTKPRSAVTLHVRRACPEDRPEPRRRIEQPALRPDEVEAGLRFSRRSLLRALEVPDPSRIQSFVDHYLDVASDPRRHAHHTGTSSDPVPPPLRDRWRDRPSGGTEEQKLRSPPPPHPQADRRERLTGDNIRFADSAVVRSSATTPARAAPNLEREVGRSAARRAP
jgi:ATP-dependent Lon protease